TRAHEDAVLLTPVADPALDGAHAQGDLIGVDEGIGVNAPRRPVHLDDLAALVLDGDRPPDHEAVDAGENGLPFRGDHLLVLDGLHLLGHGILLYEAAPARLRRRGGAFN